MRSTQAHVRWTNECESRLNIINCHAIISRSKSQRKKYAKNDKINKLAQAKQPIKYSQLNECDIPTVCEKNRARWNVMAVSTSSRPQFFLPFCAVRFVPFLVLFAFLFGEKNVSACPCPCPRVWLTVCLHTICAHLAARRDTANTISSHQLWHKHSHKNKYAKLFSLACTRCGRQSDVSSYTALWLPFFFLLLLLFHKFPFSTRAWFCLFYLKRWLSFSIYHALQSALMCSHLFFRIIAAHHDAWCVFWRTGKKN